MKDFAKTAAYQAAWEGFEAGGWQREVDVRGFILKNFAPYEGDDAFLAGATDRTKALWAKVCALTAEENKKGVMEAETSKPATITTYGPGYIDKDLEQIVGLQADAPLKRGIMPQGGIRVIQTALKSYGYELDPATEDTNTK